MEITLKLVPTGDNGKFLATPCSMTPQIRIDLAEMSKFNTLRRTGKALVLDHEMEVLRRTMARTFAEMFGVDVIEIGLPDGSVEIYDPKGNSKR